MLFILQVSILSEQMCFSYRKTPFWRCSNYVATPGSRQIPFENIEKILITFYVSVEGCLMLETCFAKLKIYLRNMHLWILVETCSLI